MYFQDKLNELVKDRCAGPKYAPFSLESLVAWLRTKPAQGEYNFFCAEAGCLWAIYTRDMGGYYDSSQRAYVVGDAAMKASLTNNTWQGLIAVEEPRTFGGALARGLLLQSEGGSP